MKRKISRAIIIIFSFSIVFIGLSNTFGEEDKVSNSDLNKSESSSFSIFETPKRVVPDFDHELHKESLGKDSCATCHHVFDTEENKLIYSEDEEAACAECHFEKKQDNTMALKQASHESCTVCHRQMKKVKKTTGPTTCGECHKK